MSFKRTKVVMLPTNEKVSLKLGQNGLLVNNTLGYDAHFTNQHLYFLSDDEIKEGDYYINTGELARWGGIPIVLKCDSLKESVDCNKFKNSCKKIIATTNGSLKISSWEPYHEHPQIDLPQPSEGFIQKFVDSYNSGNPITEVMVEYNDGQCHKTICDDNCSYPNCFEQGELKINPKDNTITIKKVKDTWTRDEVVNLLQQFNNDKSGVFDCTKWIEENL